MLITCTGCGEGFDVDDRIARIQIDHMEIRRDEDEISESVSRVRYYGLCPDCKAKAASTDVPWHPPSVEQEGRDIQNRLRRLAVEHPDWPRARCSAEAVEEHNLPRYEHNLAFRTYLLDEGKYIVDLHRPATEWPEVTVIGAVPLD